MRSLQRDWRTLNYAVPMGTEPILDENGHDTLEVRTAYSSPTLLRVNVSANAGQSAVNVFGTQTEYSRTVSYCGESCPLTVGSRVWFGVDVTGAHNYTVVGVADSKYSYLIALREVTDRA